MSNPLGRNTAPPAGISRSVILVLSALFLGGFLLVAFVLGFGALGGGPVPPASTQTASATGSLTPSETLTAFPSSTRALTITVPATSTSAQIPPPASRTPIPSTKTPTPLRSATVVRTRTRTPTGTSAPTRTKTPTVITVTPHLTVTLSQTSSPTEMTTPSPAPTQTATATQTPVAACVASAPAGFAAGADTWLEAPNPTAVHGADTGLFVRTTSAGDRRGLLQFDISSLSGSSVASAVLYVYVQSADAGLSVHLYRLTRAWNESEATWNEAIAAQPWSSPGGDYASGAVIGFIPPAGGGCYMSLDIGALVQGWFDGSIANRGVILIAGGPPDLESVFGSKESANGPVLFVTMNP